MKKILLIFLIVGCSSQHFKEEIISHNPETKMSESEYDDIYAKDDTTAFKKAIINYLIAKNATESLVAKDSNSKAGIINLIFSNFINSKVIMIV